MPLGLGPVELIIILVIVVLVFGAGRLSEVGSAVGKSMRDFRKAAKEDEEGERLEKREP
jgi:sec-independent protein translocase protein TatA